jgi:hypothetical protein
MRRVPLPLVAVAAGLLLLLGASGAFTPAAGAWRAVQIVASTPRYHTTTGPTPPPSVVKTYAHTASRTTSDEHVIAGVPAYIWRDGCGPTATGMVVGYYDSHGFDDLIPGDASTQTTAASQAIASDSRDGGAAGHYQDYSVPRDDSGPVQPDKSELPAGDEHASNCIADFMHTSWSVEGLTYGASWTNMVGPAFIGYVKHEQPAYSATSVTSYVGDPASTATWNALKAEVDAGRPMVLIVDCTGDGAVDHAIAGIGYREGNGYPEYAYYNTWDSSVHWAQYRPPSSSYAWGIYGVTAFRMSGGTAPGPTPTPDPAPTPDPTPTITALDPSSAVAGGAAFDLGVTGTDFATASSGAVVCWDGGDLVTTRDSATHLTAAVPASLIAAAGSANVTVRNGADPGAPVSAPVSFSIGNIVPALASITPSSAWAGYVKDDLTLAAYGADFLSGARITLGARETSTTAFVSAAELTVPLLAADLATPGIISVGVKNPAPGGGLSPTTQPLAVVPETTDPTVTISGADSAWHNSPVTLAFSADDRQSGVQVVQVRCPPVVPSWSTETSYTVPVTTQGAIVVDVQALDWCDHVGTASVTVDIDTTRPQTEALNAVSVKKGKTAALKFRISEPAGLSPSAEVTLKIKAVKGGRTVKTIKISDTTVNARQSYSFAVKLRRGAYEWYVYATDLAGNPQANIDTAAFTVK